jgi:hypothetical protein
MLQLPTSLLSKSSNFVSHFLLFGAKRIIGSDQSINSWINNQYNNYPLSLEFPLVFVKAKSSFVSLHEVLNEGTIKLNLTRGDSVAMRQEKSQLISIIHLLSFFHDRDSSLWLWGPNGFYSIKFMYHFSCFGGIKMNLSNSVRVLKIPLNCSSKLLYLNPILKCLHYNNELTYWIGFITIQHYKVPKETIVVIIRYHVCSFNP